MAALSKGAAGEVLAARFLREKGYQILASNYRSYIAFVEVKTRRADGMYAPREAVTAAKQRRLIRTAALYLMNESVEGQPRFDVVEVITDPQNPMRAVAIQHIPGAYEAGELDAAF